MSTRGGQGNSQKWIDYVVEWDDDRFKRIIINLPDTFQTHFVRVYYPCSSTLQILTQRVFPDVNIYSYWDHSTIASFLCR